jgi:hypothetical protein
MNPDQLKELADSQFERAAYTKTLRESISARLSIAHNGGLFLINPSLIAFLSAMSGNQVVLEDTYNNPILVNRPQLLEQATAQYTEVMSEWHEEITKSNRIRRGENV